MLNITFKKYLPIHDNNISKTGVLLLLSTAVKSEVPLLIICGEGQSPTTPSMRLK
jgi:hypothetical protein